MKKVNKLIMIPAMFLGFSLVGCDFNSISDFVNPKKEENETGVVTGVSFEEKNLSLKVGETYELKYEVLPADAPNKEVSFTSSNYSVVTVNESGLVSAKKEGSASIQIATIDGGFTDTCNVDVSENVVYVTGVELNFEEMEMTLGSSLSLQATVSPSNASNKNVTWSSLDESVVSVDNEGKLTANSLGSTTVKVVTEDGNYEASCLVRVCEETINVTGVSLNYDAFNLYVGKKYTLHATIEPYNATEQGLEWSSDDESVVTVENGTITGVSVGNANVTVSTVDGGYFAKCAVTVLEEENVVPYIPEESEDIFIITEAGEFNVDNDYKQIYVNAPDDAEVVLNLNGVTIENTENSPIFVENCDSIDISAKKGKTNNINDLRSAYTQDEDGQGKGAIYVANGDLKLKGTGTLNITANYYNGVHCKDDVKIQKQTLNIDAIHHAIKGNDSVTVTSGTLNLSCGGDGIKTENTDISESTGKQRGNVTINGGNITINSWGDAITAAYDAIIEQTDETVDLVLDIKTNKNSSYSGDLIETSASKFYLKMSSSTYSNGSYTYAAYINNQWYKAVYAGTQTTSSNQGGMGGPGGGPGGGGGSTTYYIYEIEKPADATSFKLYRFSGSNVTSFSTSNYNAVSDQKAFNDSYDMITISVRSGTISISSWSNYEGGDISSKGIKAENEVYVNSGTITINSYDDGIHTNNDAALENGSTPLGNVNISGGNITIASNDDGIHADYTLNISGGTINITTSYEGLEANLVRISGGEIYVFATDDGVNAPNGKSTPNITVSGGLLDVTVPSNGDTDGIDSNGTYTQTGGVVITKGPGSASGGGGGGSFALDAETTITISSGTLIVFGGLERTPSSSGTTRTLCSSSTVSAGSHTVSFSSASYSTTLKYSTYGCLVYSSLGSATLK